MDGACVYYTYIFDSIDVVTKRTLRYEQHTLFEDLSPLSHAYCIIGSAVPLYLSHTQSVTIITFLCYLFSRQYNTFRHTHYIDRSLTFSVVSFFVFVLLEQCNSKDTMWTCPIIGGGTVVAWHPAIV